MKNQFEFFGISMPKRKDILRQFKSNHKLTCNPQFFELINQLWIDPHREMQYIALELLASMVTKLDARHMPMIETLILTKSWWDTVDSLAPNIAGAIFKKDSECRNNYVYNWMSDSNIWLQRSSIIFQLKYKLETDWNLMCEAILRNDTSKEFFVRKGQGWALRQYSKFNPSAVVHFVEANPQLSGLTKREALRCIKP
jgi:3-methyladenine DNA glycosylase AlkD